MVVYGVSLVLLYATSTSYHAIKNQRIKKIFRMLDHSMIFLFIAGCYTPLMLVALHGTMGFAITGLVWCAAVAGVVITVFFMDKMKNTAVLLYVAMALIILFVMEPLAVVLPTSGLYCLLGSGIAYLIGVAFYLLDRIPFNHAIWHICVLVGTASHFACVFRYVLEFQ